MIDHVYISVTDTEKWGLGADQWRHDSRAT